MSTGLATPQPQAVDDQVAASRFDAAFARRRALLDSTALHDSLDITQQIHTSLPPSTQLANLVAWPPDGLSDHAIRDKILQDIGTFRAPRFAAGFKSLMTEREYRRFKFDKPEGSSTLQRIASRMSACMGQCFIERSRSNPTCCQVWPHRCNIGICPFCNHRKVADWLRRFESMRKSCTRPPKLITLTQKALRGESPAPAIDRIQTWFESLRRRSVWRAVDACVYVVQMTLNPRSKAWHVHIHVLADAEFIKQSTLRKVWERVTDGCGKVVHIREADEGGTKALAYMLRYPQQMATLPRSHLREFVLAVRDRHLVNTTGNWRKKPSHDTAGPAVKVARRRSPRNLIPLDYFERHVRHDRALQALLPSLYAQIAVQTSWRIERRKRFEQRREAACQRNLPLRN